MLSDCVKAERAVSNDCVKGKVTVFNDCVRAKVAALSDWLSENTPLHLNAGAEAAHRAHGTRCLKRQPTSSLLLSSLELSDTKLCEP